MTDETIRLILELAGTGSVKELTAALAEQKTAAQATADSYEVLERKAGDYDVLAGKNGTAEQQRSDARVAAAVEQTRASQAIARALGMEAEAAGTTTKSKDKLTTATEKASKSQREMSMRVLNTGRALQDFAQGGLGGIINNIEGVVGGGGMLAGVLTAVGVAALVATPHIKALWNSWVDGSNEIPKSSDLLAQWGDELKKASKQLDELKEKESLTNAELRKYNDLTAESIDLEKKRKAEQAARAADEKLNDLKGPGQQEDEAERAKNLQAIVGGRQDQLLAEVAAAMREEDLSSAIETVLGAREKQAKHAKTGSILDELTKDEEKALKQAQARIKQIESGDTPKETLERAQRAISDAVIGGGVGALQALIAKLPSDKTMLDTASGRIFTQKGGSHFRDALASQMPDAQQSEEEFDREFEASNNRAIEARKAREAKAKSDKAEAKAQEKADKHDAREAKSQAEADDLRELRGMRALHDKAKEAGKHAKDLKHNLTGANHDDATMRRLLGDDFMQQAEAAQLGFANPMSREGAAQYRHLKMLAEQRMLMRGATAVEAHRLAGNVGGVVAGDIHRHQKATGLSGAELQAMLVMAQNQKQLAATQKADQDVLRAAREAANATRASSRSSQTLGLQ